MLLGFASAEDGLIDLRLTGLWAQSSTYARTGTYSYRVAGGGNFSGAAVLTFAEKAEIFFQLAIRVATVSDTEHAFFGWRNGSTFLGTIAKDGINGLKVYLGNKTTEIGSIPVGLPSTDFMVIEGRVVLDDTSGIVQIRVHGVLVVDYAGDTMPGAEATLDNIIMCGHVTTSNWYTYFDDIIVCDALGAAFNSWPMGIKCHKVDAPAANGNYAQWTPSAGDNYQCIDESPPSMDDYVEGAAGQKDSYVFGNAPAGLSGIAGVVTRFWGQGNGNIKRLCRYDGADYLSNAFAVPGTFNKVDDVMAEKPGGGGWDEATFNACEFGMEHQ